LRERRPGAMWVLNATCAWIDRRIAARAQLPHPLSPSRFPRKARRCFLWEHRPGAMWVLNATVLGSTAASLRGRSSYTRCHRVDSLV